MSEETEQPQRNVPRVMYLSYIYYWIWVYIISCAYLLCVSPWSTDKYSLALIVRTEIKEGANSQVPVAEIFNTPQWFTYINTFVLMSASVTQVISAVVVTSRFLFSM
jgi:amino acid transporter